MSLFVDEEVRDRVRRLELPFNSCGVDPYGVSMHHLERAFTVMRWLSKHYFTLKVRGLEHVPTRGRAMLVGNHSGGLPVDALMVITSIFLGLEPPRLVQGMVEKFVNRMPFASAIASRTGQFTGLPEHALQLLQDDRLTLVFPEGARGTAKLFKDRNSLVRFGTGFVRLALEAKAPIIPFSFVGGGEAIPTVLNSLTLGRLLGAPYVPITPYLLPLPLPVQLDIDYGEPIELSGTGSEDDEVIAAHVETVRQKITELGENARRRRDGVTS